VFVNRVSLHATAETDPLSRVGPEWAAKLFAVIPGSKDWSLAEDTRFKQQKQ